MKIQRLVILLVFLNIVLFFCIAAASRNGNADVQPVLRVQALELVDDRGVVRATLNVETNGEAVFRIRDQEGTIRVKVSGSKDGAGFVLLNDSTEPGVHALAKRDGTKLTLTGKNGEKRVIEP
jgi:hypothetical protein